MAYLKTINTALAALRANAETKHLAKMGLDKLLQNIDQVPKDLQGPVRNGGEHARRPRPACFRRATRAHAPVGPLPRMHRRGLCEPRLVLELHGQERHGA